MIMYDKDMWRFVIRIFDLLKFSLNLIGGLLTAYVVVRDISYVTRW